MPSGEESGGIAESATRFAALLLSMTKMAWKTIVSRFGFRTRYSRVLEAEIARLRAENRALVNSILGIAGIPPMRIAVAGQAVGAALALPGRPSGRPYQERSGARCHARLPRFGFRASAFRPVKPCDTESSRQRAHKVVGANSEMNAVSAPSFAPAPRQAAQREEVAKAGTANNRVLSVINCSTAEAQSDPFRDSSLASHHAPLRRRSWPQIERALEHADARAARRERESDTETFPAPRTVVPRV